MKKLLALLISLMMAVSLAVPAFALEAVFPISAPVDGMDDYWDDDYDWWAEEQAYLDSHPGLEEQLRANAYDYFNKTFGPYEGSPEAYMELWGFTEEEFLEEMVLWQVSELIWAEQYQQAIDALKESMGGVPGQLGVMVNGQYIRFPDAVPEAANNRTMVPVRALVETLGGEVGYQDGTVQFSINGREYEFVIGSTTVTVRADGIPVDTIEMDCAPYAKNNRTYVPIRFISEALGYEVNWDSEYQTAILLDREALAADIDTNLSIMNRALAAANPALEEGESWSFDLEGKLSLTLFDTLNGDQTYEADLTGEALFNRDALNGSCSVTFSDSTINALMALMLGVGDFGDNTEENVQLIRSVLTGLEDMELIMNREGRAWFHAPILDELGNQENAWFAMNLGAELGEMMFAETGTVTVGSVLTDMLFGDSVEEMASLGEMVGLLDLLCSDGKFTTADGVSTLSIGADDLTDLYQAMGIDSGAIEDEVKNIKEFNITVEVDSEGGTVMSVVMETNAQLGSPAIRLTAHSAQDRQGSAVTMELHIANLGKLALELTTSQQATSESPLTEPPEGAVIVETDGSELMQP